MGSTGRALIVAAAGDGRQWLVQRLARIVESKLHQMRRCDRAVTAGHERADWLIYSNWVPGIRRSPSPHQD